MKDFNLEDALAGKPVLIYISGICLLNVTELFVTRNKKKLVVIDEWNSAIVFNIDGSCIEKGHSMRLVMPDQQIMKGWINIYQDHGNRDKHTVNKIYSTHFEAMNNADGNVIDTIEITWEE